jgi:hypothetical protein
MTRGRKAEQQRRIGGRCSHKQPSQISRNVAGPALLSQFSSGLLKKASCRLLKKIQRRGAQKSILRLRSGQAGGVLTVRCSEAIERNEAYGSFSAAC